MFRFFITVIGVMLVATIVSWFVMRNNAADRPALTGFKPGQNMQELLPYADLYTREEVRREFDLQRVTPLGNDRFYFEVLVPKGWASHTVEVTRQQLADDDQLPVPLWEVGPRGMESVILEARYMRVPQRVSLERFMTVFAKKRSYQIMARQRGDFNGREIEDVLVRVSHPRLGPVLTRITASRRGGFVFMVAGSAREAEYPQWRRIFGAAALTFNPSGK